MDRDGAIHAAFREVLERDGIESVRTPHHSPSCNAHIERFNGSFNREAAERINFLGEDHLRRTIDEDLVYHHRERNHQGLAGTLIDPEMESGSLEGSVHYRQRLGGMLNYYYREAA